jgi:hypothetical protein
LIEFWYSKGQTGLGQSGQIHLNIKVEDTKTPLPSSPIDSTKEPTLSASPTDSYGQIQPSQYPDITATTLIVVVLMIIGILTAIAVWYWQSGQKSKPPHSSPPIPPTDLPPPPPPPPES